MRAGFGFSPTGAPGLWVLTGPVFSTGLLASCLSVSQGLYGACLSLELGFVSADCLLARSFLAGLALEVLAPFLVSRVKSLSPTAASDSFGCAPSPAMVP